MKMGKKKQKEETEIDFTKFEVEFAPGCFDEFEGDQSELDEFVAAIKAAVKDGSLFENAVPADDYDTDEEIMRGYFDIPKNTRN